MSDQEKIVGTTLDAVFEIIRNKKIQARLLEEEEAKKVVQELHLPQAAIGSLQGLVNRLELMKSEQQSSNKKEQNTQEVPLRTRQEIQDILLESFIHIRWSFWVSLVMSVTLFILGMFFLGAAVYKSISEAAVSTATLTIAGIGIADFVLLFYTRPWQDISKNLSNSQQVKIIATSYLSGLALINQKRSDDLLLLEKLTKNSVGMIQKYLEEAPQDKEKSKEESPIPGP